MKMEIKLSLFLMTIGFTAFAVGCGSGESESGLADAAAGLVASLNTQEGVEVFSTGAPVSDDIEAVGIQYAEHGEAGKAVGIQYAEHGEAGTVGRASSIFSDKAGKYVVAALYDQANLGGSVLSIWAQNGARNSQVSSLVPSGWNDRIRSYVLKGGCKATFYTDVNFTGSSVSFDRTGKESGYVASTTQPGSSSIKFTCADTNDAAALAFKDANQTGAMLPVWDRWNLTESGMGDWDTSISSIDMNTTDTIGGQDMSVKLTVSQYSGDPLRVYFDLNTFPSDVNDKIVGFLMELGERPRRCSESLSCYTMNAQCIGQAQFITSRQDCWDRRRGQSYCTHVNVCVDPRTNIPIP